MSKLVIAISASKRATTTIIGRIAGSVIVQKRPNGPLAPPQMARLLERLESEGELSRLLRRYHLRLGEIGVPDRKAN